MGSKARHGHARVIRRCHISRRGPAVCTADSRDERLVVVVKVRLVLPLTHTHAGQQQLMACRGQTRGARERRISVRHDKSNSTAVCCPAAYACIYTAASPHSPRTSCTLHACPSSLASTPPGTHPPNILVGGTSTGISPPILLRTFGYSRPILVVLRSLSLKPISFGYKTPPPVPHPTPFAGSSPSTLNSR